MYPYSNIYVYMRGVFLLSYIGVSQERDVYVYMRGVFLLSFSCLSWETPLIYTYIWIHISVCMYHTGAEVVYMFHTRERLLSYIRVYVSEFVYMYHTGATYIRVYVSEFVRGVSLYELRYIYTYICIYVSHRGWGRICASYTRETPLIYTYIWIHRYVCMHPTGAKVVYMYHARERFLSYISIYGYIYTYICIIQERDSFSFSREFACMTVSSPCAFSFSCLSLSHTHKRWRNKSLTGVAEMLSWLFWGGMYTHTHTWHTHTLFWGGWYTHIHTH